MSRSLFATSISCAQTISEPSIPAAAVTVLTLVSRPQHLNLRVNSAAVAQSTAKVGPGSLNQLTIGWGYQNHVPIEGFGGFVFAAVTGKGRPSQEKLEVLERYLGKGAGLARRRPDRT